MANTERTGISGGNQRGSGSPRTEIKERQDGTGVANESGDRSEIRGTPTHIDLFSGIGGFALAAQWAGFRTIAFCEIDKYCQKVLAKNFMADATSTRCNGKTGQHDGGRSLSSTRLGERSGRTASLHGNIFDFDGTRYSGCDLLTGGFPCQPFSVAGKRRGAADDRAIWPEMFRVIKEARPAWVLGENVPGIIPMELDNVLSDMESIGYATRPFVIPACAVDARHRRDRLWIICRDVSDGNEPGSQGRNGAELRECSSERITRQEDSLANSKHQQLNGSGRRRRWRPESTDCCRWEPEPDVGRVVARLSTGMDGGRLNGTPSRGGTDTILQALRNPSGASEIQWPTGGLGRFQTTEQLLNQLCEYKGKAKPLEHVSLASKETSEITVRGVWFDGSVACPSCRRIAGEQRSHQSPNAVHTLPLLLACGCGATWLDPSGTPSESSRVNRLKGLGNSIVPQVAFEILREIRRLI